MCVPMFSIFRLASFAIFTFATNKQSFHHLQHSRKTTIIKALLNKQIHCKWLCVCICICYKHDKYRRIVFVGKTTVFQFSDSLFFYCCYCFCIHSSFFSLEKLQTTTNVKRQASTAKSLINKCNNNCSLRLARTIATAVATTTTIATVVEKNIAKNYLPSCQYYDSLEMNIQRFFFLWSCLVRLF